MKFTVPDPDKFRISECGMYIIEKITVPGEDPVYAVWAYTRVLYGAKSAKEAAQAVKTREFAHQQSERKFFEHASKPEESDHHA